MKHMTKLLSLMLVAVLCVVMLVSCKPAETADEAVAALKENDYTILAHTDSFVSASKGNEDSILESDSIMIYYFDSEEEADKMYEELKKSQEEAIEKAEEYLEGLKESGLVGDAVIETAEDALDATKAVKVDKSGTMVWMGTSDAIKAAK